MVNLIRIQYFCGKFEKTQIPEIENDHHIFFTDYSELHTLYSRTPDNNKVIPFTATPSSSSLLKEQHSKIISFNYTIQNNRIWLNWTFDKTRMQTSLK